MSYFKTTLCFIAIAFTLSSCGSSEPQEKEAWTDAQKKEFKDNCFTSTRFSFQQMGKPLADAQINTICDCTAQEIESQYSYKAASRIPKAKVQEILSAALEKCAPDVMAQAAADTIVPAK